MAFTQSPNTAIYAVEVAVALARAIRQTRPPDDILERANCAGTPIRVFFPVDRSRVSPTAADMCRTCLVRVECRDWARAQQPPVEGVWGGESAVDRRRHRQAAAA